MNLDLITALQIDFERFYDENFKLRNKEVYNKEIDSFNKRLEEAGISSKLSPKEIELKLQQIYEELMKGPTNTTLTPEQLKDFGEQADKRNQQNIDIRAREKQTIEDYIRQNQEIIAKAQAVQEQLKDKVIYATIEIPKAEILSENEQKDLETLREFATNSEETRTKLIDDLATKIESKLENVPVEQKEIIARTAAVEIVEKLAKPEIAIETQVQTAILSAIHEDKTQVLPKVLKDGATLLALENRNSEFFTKDVSKNLFGPKLAEAIYGSNQIQVILSETRIEGQTTHQVNLGDLNQNQIQVLNHQSELLNSVQKFGVDKASSVFTNYTRSYMAEKIASMPANSIVKKAYRDPVVQSIFARYGMAEPVVWQAVGQSRFVGLVMKIAPDTAGPVLGLVSKVTGKQLVTPIATKVAGQAIAKGAVATSLSATLSATFGSFAPIVGHAIGAVVGWIGGELLSRLKTWWTKNKKSIKPFLVGGLAVGGLMFGGPAVGGIVLLGGLAAAGGLAAFATGAFGVLGFIGRSVGIAIATPVIITLLIIPPLVALILLVINNSAYVVPPSFESGEGGFTPVECQGEAPEKPTATNIKYSSDGKYAFPTAPFEMPGYACYHWDGNKAADIFSPQNKPPMVAYESGTISSVVLNDSLGGKYIMLKGASGRHYYYAHLCHVFVKSGETVKVGDVIATMDETGSGRVQHLHYAINEPPLTDTFIGGDGNVCPQKDFEEKFGFGVCNTNNACVNP